MLVLEWAAGAKRLALGGMAQVHMEWGQCCAGRISIRHSGCGSSYADLVHSLTQRTVSRNFSTWCVLQGASPWPLDI